MGKEEEEQPAFSGGASASPDIGGDVVRTCRRCVTWQCVAVVLLGFAVLLSAVFWLPPFDTWHREGVGSGSDDTDGADIIASFRLQRTASELKQNISKLEYDIYGEIGIPGTIVSITSLEPLNGSNNTLNGSNYTTVVFSIFPYPKDTSISPTWLSILRSSFMSLVVEQSTLHLTTSLFGNSSSFEVEKFPGGITIIPPQSAFLLLKPHAFFNFTLNFPIYKVQGNIDELKDQMKMGLLLNSYENLFVKLTNLEGSTVNAPTIVQTSIVLEVGNHQPSQPRLRQLAQTITNSSSRSNLGLNHTTFGKVKQISLSSYLRHSLTNGPTGSYAPGPAPTAHFHHRHHHKGHGVVPSPDPVHAPAPAPKEERGYNVPPPAGCRFGNGKKNESVARSRAAVPVPAPSPSNERLPPGEAPVRGFGGVSFQHVRPPSESERREKGSVSNEAPSPSLPPQPSSAHVDHMVKIGWFVVSLVYLLL